MENVRRCIVDKVIEYFSGGKVNCSDEVLQIMAIYNKDWDNCDADYDTSEGAEILNKIIESCVDEIMEHEGLAS